jgi:hypothetical protein
MKLVKDIFNKVEFEHSTSPYLFYFTRTLVHDQLSEDES